MTYQEFVNKWLGKGIDYDGAYGNQCMDVYRMYVKEVLDCPQSPSVTGAKEVWDNYLKDCFTRIDNTPEGIPKNGDIIIWSVGQYGHIAICDHANISELTCFEQNWTELDGSGVTELRKHNYGNILGWLTPKGGIIPDMEADERRAIQILEDFKNSDNGKEFKDGNLEGTTNGLIGKYKDLGIANESISNLNKDIRDLNGQIDEMDTQIDELETEIAENKKSTVTWQRKLSTANKQIENLTKERNDYKRWYELALKDQANKYTGWELIGLGLRKLLIKEK